MASSSLLDAKWAAAGVIQRAVFIVQSETSA
jgi:hypothetical protein